MLKPILIFASAVCGILAGFATGSMWPAAGFMAVAIVIWFSAYYILRKNTARFHLYTRLHSVWPCMLCACLGALSAYWHLPSPERLPLYEECVIYGIVEDARSLTTGDCLTVRLYSVAPSGGGEIRCRNISAILYAGGDIRILPGDEVVYKSVLLPNKHYAPGRPAYISHDMVRIYEKDGAGVSEGRQRYHLKSGDLRMTGHHDNLTTMTWHWRNEVAKRLESSVLSAESAGLLRALLTGERGGIKEESASVFRDGGVSHTLAVSGLHVGIIAGVLAWLTLPVNLLRWRRVRLAMICAGIWCFTLFTGLMYSTLRAALMFTFSIIGRESGRRQSSMRGVCMAAFLILMVCPYALWDVGFQLSFLCVAALIVFVEPMNPISHRHHPTVYNLVSAMLVTLVATGATWILSARYFGAVPLNFMLCNMIVLPAIPLLMGGGLLYTLLLMAGIDFVQLGYLIDMSVRILYGIIDRCNIQVLDCAPSLISVLLWYGGVVLLAISLHYYRPAARTLPGAMVIPVRRTPDGTIPLHRPMLIASILLLSMSLIVI